MISFNYKNSAQQKNNIYLKVQDASLNNDWGWFIDIESNSIILHNKYFHNKYFHKPSLHLLVPETIQECPNECPSICSMKSINNLCDFYTYKLEEDNYKDKPQKNILLLIYCNIIGIITLILTYYIIYFY